MNDAQHSYFLNDIQKGLLFEICNDKSRLDYIVQMVLKINNELDVSLFKHAFESVISRHEVLRSAISLHQKGDTHQYIQDIYEKITLPFTHYDYSCLTSAEKEQNYHLFLEHDVNQPIDIEIAPLMRVNIFKFSDKETRIVWTRHHLLMGGFSVETVIRELFTIYEAALHNKATDLPPPTSYKEVHSYRSPYNNDEAEAHWQQSMAKYSQAGFLPPALSSEKNIRLKKKKQLCEFLSGHEYITLVNFVKNHHLTIDTLLQAAWGIVISHYSNKDVVIFGSVKAYPPEIVGDCVGLFINTLPVCFETNPSTKIIDYLHGIRQQNIALKTNITLPLNKIKEWCHISLDVPLYQSIIDYKPHSLNSMVKKKFEAIDCDISFKLDIPYPLVLEVINCGTQLQIKFHYQTDLYDDNYATTILMHFKNILVLLTQQSHQLISSLPTLSNPEIQTLLQWNETNTTYPLNKTIHELFEEQVKKMPTAIALSYEGSFLTYQQLNEQANQLAHYLIAHKVSPETLVALYLKPNFNMIVAILAVLKVGAIYVPLDLNYPAERIKYILQDSQSKIVITQSLQIDSLKKITEDSQDLLVVNLDYLNYQNYNKDNPCLPISSANAMYVIYTSGSTGIPKGVILEHRAVANTILACIEKLHLTPHSRILQISSFSFDVAAAEWGMTLLSGASLYLMDKDIFSPSKIVETLKKNKITAIILASSILATLPKVDLPDLKVIAPGGECCDQNTIDFWSQRHLLLNIYGITETAICSTITPYHPGSNASIIGKPLPNMKVYILNQHSQLTPIGAYGEIYIGGESLARGYLNRPALTKEKFLTISNLPSEELPNRLYKTGDLGRWLPTGELEFLGRRDNQIKIRGFRIELTEIERILEKNSNVNRAIVLVKSVDNAKQLHAYILSKIKPLIPNDLIYYLKDRLPHYMIPVKFIELDTLPLTPNGKLDKEKLLSIETYDSNPKFILDNKSKIEKSIMNIVKSTLSCGDIEKEKNFMDCGFDSLSLVKFSAQLSIAFELNIDIVDLFTYPNIETLANYIETKKKPLFLKEKKVDLNIPFKKRIEFSDDELYYR